MEDDKPRNDLDYRSALHGIQTGVMHQLERDRKVGTPKDLRTGLNSAMVNDAALARLLVKKGLFTMDEYMEELRLEANRELDRMEDIVRGLYGTDKITLR